jgi:GntR family transcriptional regulator
MKWRIDPDLTLPLHQQVEKIIRTLVEKPEYQSGLMFPKEVDIASELGIARNTVRTAIAKLVQEGILVRKKGVGTMVVRKKLLTRLDHWFSFTKEMEEKGRKIINYRLEVKLVKAPPELVQIEQDFTRPLYKVLEEENNVYVTLSREDISAIAATNDLAENLQIKPGDPILTRNRTVYSSDGQIVEYNQVFYRGDGISYSVEIGR